MGKRSDVPTRGEISETVERHQQEMHERSEEVEKTVDDVETVRQTLENLDLGGTSEGSEAIEGAIDAAEDAGVGEFKEESEGLEQVELKSEEHEGEIHERSDTTSADLGKISDASGRLHGDAANRELVDAKEEALRDVEFLKEQAARAEDARNESRQLHEEHERRVQSGRGS